MKKIIAAALLLALIIPAVTTAQTSVSDLQNQIQKLLQLVSDLQAKVAALNQSPNCVILTHTLYLGSRDAYTGGEVTKLQAYLKKTGDYTYPVVTGYFGAFTEQAVKMYQIKKGIVSGGSAFTTGFGMVGPRTRAVIAASCLTPQPTPPATTTPTSTTPAFGLPVTMKASPTEGKEPLKVTFQATRVPTAGKYYMSFGDGSESGTVTLNKCTSASCVTQFIGSHTYTTTGTFKATLNQRYECPANATICIDLYSMAVASATIKVLP